MAFRPEVDATDLRQLIVDLEGAPRRVQRNTRDTLWKGAGLVQRSMRKQAGGHRHLRHLPKAVTREMIDNYTAEIGFETTRGTQGRLAHIIVYGSVNNAPVFDHTQSLRRRAPEVERMFADMAEESVLGDER